jgi:ubiquinone/menaquinone biosynthesis C-methylase UbiE
MAHVCPWWLTYTFDNPLRRLLHDRRALLGPLVREGMTVADLGCGMGFFTVALAELVGPGGRVLAVDVQPRQLEHAGRRCERAGVRDRVELVRADGRGPMLRGPVDLALSFWMLHEVEAPDAFVDEVVAALRPGAAWLVAEPRLHVGAARFAEEVALLERRGLAGAPLHVRWSHARLFTKPRPA